VEGDGALRGRGEAYQPIAGEMRHEGLWRAFHYQLKDVIKVRIRLCGTSIIITANVTVVVSTLSSSSSHRRRLDVIIMVTVIISFAVLFRPTRWWRPRMAPCQIAHVPCHQPLSPGV
jgi:hypothetical protein